MRKHFLLFITIALLMLNSFEAKAQTGVENYVSASGYAIFHAPSYFTGNDGYVYDFELDYDEGRLLDWITIDADGDGHNWKFSEEGGYGHNGSDGVMLSYSYDNYSGALSPDNYLVSPKISVTQNCHVARFFASAMDEAYPADHFGLAVSTTTNANPSAFTMLQEWTMTSKYNGKKVERDGKGLRQGNWHEYSADLSAYIGQEIYIAIRHFNSTDNFCLCVDDVMLVSDNPDPLTECSIKLDGATVAQNVEGIHYLFDTEGFSDGSTHTATVAATYQSGATMEKETSWTFRSSDNFAGSPTGLDVNSNGSQVTLSWTLPQMTVPYTIDELYYDFTDSTLSDLTLIDANNDGRNFRVYPYGGYGGGNCLKSDSWVAGGAGNVNPDNFLVMPRLVAGENAQISFMAVDCDMPGTVTDPEHFGVAVSTSGNINASDFVMLSEWNSTGTYTEYSADLSAYAGQQIYVAIRHFNTTGDCYYLYVDNIKLTDIEAEVTRNAKGALLFANGEHIATLNHGETRYTHMVNRYVSEYCIRIIQDGSRETGNYCALAAPQCANAELECLAPKNLSGEFDGQKVKLSWEREIFIDFEDDPQGWTFLDADGDSYVFGIYAGGGMNSDGTVNTTNTNASLSSFSYINNVGPLTPDNYAFMPKVKILPNASMTFYAAGFDPSYPNEPFGVAVASEDGVNIATIQSWVSSYPYSRYSVDLSAYAGQEIYLGFRHSTTTAAYALCIDNITVTNAVWAGTASETVKYKIYRSFDGINYSGIGWADGDAVSYNDNGIQSVDQYYKVTAYNTISGGEMCESSPAIAVDAIHDYIHVTTDGVEETDYNVSVYPNPTNNVVNISANGIKNVMVINALGQTVYETRVDSDSATIDLAMFGTGIYMLRIGTSNGVSLKRVMVR